ncbi:S-layer homology domain-containing protein [Paenibacillus sp. FA6]|uniref:S-layer homology domain-containing protein n=1 Tax=Paenibacillus sp. FA6 TaxID=3413029 RepID=UPI003F65D75C
MSRGYKKQINGFIAIILLLGTLSINFATEAYAAAPPSNVIREITPDGAFSMRAEGEFSNPGSVTADVYGNIYVADTNNHRIQKFDSNGVYVMQWGEPGNENGQFINPNGIAVDPAGDVYVVESWNNRIQKFDSDGGYITQWGEWGYGNGQFYNANGITVDQAGNVYVLDSDQHRIQKFTSDGDYLMQWGNYGKGDGQFDKPSGIAVDPAGNVYVADTSNNRIQKFASDGDYVTQWGEPGNGNGQFGNPSAIAVDPAGNVYVADRSNDRIQKFDSDGGYLAQWGEFGYGNGQFYNPNGLAVDQAGNVYVADSVNDRILKFNSDYTYAMQWGESGSPFIRSIVDIAVGGGNVYVGEMQNNRLLKFDSAGNFRDKWQVVGSDEQGASLSRIVADEAGNTYVIVSNVIYSDKYKDYFYYGHVTKYDPDGNKLWKWEYAGNDGEQFFDPVGVTLDEAGHVYVAGSVYDAKTDSTTHLVVKVDAAGTYLKEWLVGVNDTENDKLGGIAVDQTGHSYVTVNECVMVVVVNESFSYCSDYSSHVMKLDAAGNHLLQWDGSGSDGGQFGYLQGITVDQAGHVYVFDRSNERIVIFNLNGDYMTQWDGADGLGRPYGVTLDKSGNIYILDEFSGGIKIYRANNNTDITSLAISSGTLSPPFSPNNITHYTASVAASVDAVTITPVLVDSEATVSVTVESGLVTSPVHNNGTSFDVPLNTGSNLITVMITAYDRTTTANYTIDVTRESTAQGGNGDSSTAPTPPSGNGDAPTAPTPPSGNGGAPTVPTPPSGKVALKDSVTLSIPEGAADKELNITIEEVLNTQQLLTNKEILASQIYEILKDVSGNLKKPITLTFKFDKSKVNEGQYAAIFYYDEVNKTWIEIGGKIIDNTITVDVDHFAKFAVLVVDEPTVTYSDIAGHWAESEMKQASQQGIVKGYLDGTFKPNATVSRAEFTVMLMNALKLTSDGVKLGFSDSDKIGIWARQAVAQSIEVSIVSGYDDGSFRPTANITRAELAAMIAKAYGARSTTIDATDFADDNDIPVWAKSAITTMKELGIISGRGDNKFAPKETATRAEAVTIIMNLLEAK